MSKCWKTNQEFTICWSWELKYSPHRRENCQAWSLWGTCRQLFTCICGFFLNCFPIPRPWAPCSEYQLTAASQGTPMAVVHQWPTDNRQTIQDRITSRVLLAHGVLCQERNNIVWESLLKTAELEKKKDAEHLRLSEETGELRKSRIPELKRRHTFHTQGPCHENGKK